MKTIKQIITQIYGQDIGQMDAKLFNQEFVSKAATEYARQQVELALSIAFSYVRDDIDTDMIERVIIQELDK